MVDVPKVAILFGFGINCDRETAAVFEGFIESISSSLKRRERVDIRGCGCFHV